MTTDQCKFKWITMAYAGASRSGLTNIYVVRDVYGNQLGTVKWYGPWRKYAFYPDVNTLYEWECLRDIAVFVEDITKAHKEGRVAITFRGPNR